MFKVFRVSILLFVLVFVALGAWRAKTHSVEWKYTLPVNIYLINGDGSAVAAGYIRSLVAEDFRPVASFMTDEAARYGRSNKASIEIRMGGVIENTPPQPPRNGGKLDVIFWSLNMRWWAYRNTDMIGPDPQIRMFLLYFDPAQSKLLAHSTGLQKGLLGLVNVFASPNMAPQNNVVITHEFLHTLGATDKYDQANQPLYPDGYAEPEVLPLYPQHFAEIMAGRIPISQTQAEIPASLERALIGNKTAQEINWLEKVD